MRWIELLAGSTVFVGRNAEPFPPENILKYRTLGRTGLEVSLVGFGGGGPSRIGQTTHGDEDESHRVLHRALELGVNYFDTAADYSDSEGIIGRAFKDTPRDRYLLGTKFAPNPEPDGKLISPEEMIASCERSLRRLQVETIDVYQFHGVLPGDYRAAVERLYPTALRLKEQGKIRFLGVTEYFFKDPAHKMLRMALEDDLWDAVMVKYGILNFSADRDVLPMAAGRNVGVLGMSPVRVKLTRPAELEKVIARWKEKGLLPQGALPEKDPLAFLVHGDVPSVVSAGYKFAAAAEALSTLIVGTGNIQHLEANIDAVLGDPLPAEDVQRLRELFGDLAESEGDTG